MNIINWGGSPPVSTPNHNNWASEASRVDEDLFANESFMGFITQALKPEGVSDKPIKLEGHALTILKPYTRTYIALVS